LRELDAGQLAMPRTSPVCTSVMMPTAPLAWVASAAAASSFSSTPWTRRSMEIWKLSPRAPAARISSLKARSAADRPTPPVSTLPITWRADSPSGWTRTSSGSKLTPPRARLWIATFSRGVRRLTTSRRRSP